LKTPTRPGRIEIIVESLMIFVKECIRLGVDGFYASTQGGESYRFKDQRLFREVIEPSDRMVMEEMNRSCIFNVLHVCDYQGAYTDLTPYLDYPAGGLAAALRTYAMGRSVRCSSALYMGGMEQRTIVTAVRGN
jgi:uroporphyrinogen decarboxylase